MATLNFPVLRLTKEQIKGIFTNSDTKGFNRICMQLYSENGVDFTLVIQVLARGRKKIGPPVIFISPDEESKSKMKTTTTKDFVFCQYEISKSQLKQFSKSYTKDIILTPRIEPINPDAVSYDLDSGSTLNPCPPAIPPTN